MNGDVKSPKSLEFLDLSVYFVHRELIISQPFKKPSRIQLLFGVHLRPLPSRLSLSSNQKCNYGFMKCSFRHCQDAGLVKRRLVSGDGAHISATFSRPERGRTAKSPTEIHLAFVFPVFLKRRLVAAPLPLTQGTLRQPTGGTRALVTNDFVLTVGLAIPDSSPSLSKGFAVHGETPGRTKGNWLH